MTSDAQSICCNHEVRGFLGVVMFFLSAPPAPDPLLDFREPLAGRRRTHTP